jgi:hypothetical protein
MRGISRLCATIGIACVTICTFGHVGLAQPADPFDAAILVKKSIWANLATVVPGAKLSLANGSISIVDAAFCGASDTEAKFLVAIKLKEPMPYIVVQEKDCNTALADLARANANPSYDGLARVSVKRADAGLAIEVGDVAARPTADVSAALLKDIRSYKTVSGRQKVAVGSGPSKEDIELTLQFANSGILARVYQSGASHALKAADLPKDFPASQGNMAIVLSHEAIARTVQRHLKDTPIPIKGADAKVHVESYSGSGDRVTVSVRVTSSGLMFGGSASWTGANLLLSEYAIKSLRDCSGKSGFEKPLCEGARTLETKTAETFAEAEWPKFKSTKMVPLTRADKIRFELFGRPAFFAGQTLSNSASERTLTIVLDAFVGIEK